MQENPLIECLPDEKPETGSRLMVYMLGGFEMYFGGALVQLKKRMTSKPLQLLQLLLWSGEAGISRHAVLEALFGQEQEIDAANNLNATVSQLRRLLRETHLPAGNYIHMRLDRYYFESPLPLWVDIAQVSALRREADLKSGNERLKLLYELCDHFRGRFLPALDGEDWVEIARADYQRLYRDSLNEVCHALKEAHRFDEIQRLAELASRLFPFDEWQVWQQEALLAQGRIRDAHDLYLKVEKLYMSEMDAPPPERMRAHFRKPEKDAWRKDGSTGTVRTWLKQADQDGPYAIPFPSFLYVYNLIHRMNSMAREAVPFVLMLCTLSAADGRSRPDSREFQEALEQLEKVLTASLRWEDVFTRYSRSQYLVILLGARPENLESIAERLKNRYPLPESDLRFKLDCQLVPDAKMPVKSAEKL